MALAEQQTEVWEQRFRTPISFLPEWSPLAPDRCTYASSEAGVWQLYAWNVASGERRQVTESAVGVVDGTPTLDGEGVLWFDDETGDEAGRWLVQPFGGGEKRPFLENVPYGWSNGLAQAPGIVAVGVSNRDGFAIHVALDGDAARELYRSADFVGLGEDPRGFFRAGLSTDGALLCLQHSEHGDLIHPAMRVVDPRSGDVTGEQFDEGRSLVAKAWSPVSGDQRLAFEHDTTGEVRPAL
jgi:hypothetical protein